MAEAWQDYFERGEKLIWEGVPKKRGRMGIGTIGLALFGLPFLTAGLGISGGGLVALLGFVENSESFGGSILMFVFGLPFLGFGVGMVFGPWYALRNAHKKIRYALSNRRGYVATTWWGRKMEILSIPKDGFIEVRDGHSVFFHAETVIDSDGDRRRTRKGFENIDDAMHVYNLIRKIQAGDYERFR